MSDILCQSCDEPWDGHHLRYDAIFETNLPEESCRTWDGRLTPSIRRELEQAGYRFGNTIASLRACPSCPVERSPSKAGRQRADLANAAESVLGDDLDALISELAA